MSRFLVVYIPPDTSDLEIRADWREAESKRDAAEQVTLGDAAEGTTIYVVEPRHVGTFYVKLGGPFEERD